MNEQSPQAIDAAKLPALPLAITSFGADRSDTALYVYGGHHGQAHHYSTAGQSGELLRLDLQKPKAWEKIAAGPKLQGLALVAHNDKLYRLGGFEARNAEGEEHDLWSVAECAVFDNATRQWSQLPAMPTARSSFDATLVGDTIYVVGGWAMQGDKDTLWRDDAYALDLSQDKLHWQKIAKPPFERRALAVGHRDGKVYVIGGMQPKGKITRDVAVYDPRDDAWSEGPTLPETDNEMEGFGAACCTIDNQLYVTTSGGKLLKLSPDAESWKTIRQLDSARFFHQMLPLSADKAVVIAGANMEQGRFRDVATIELSAD